MDAKLLGAFIAELRKEQNMTQTELAEKLNVTDKAVSRWERGVGLPDVTMIEPLAKALHVTIAEIMKGSRMTAEELLRENDSECLQKLINDMKKDTRMTTWNYAILVITILMLGFFMQYTYRDPKEIYGGAFAVLQWSIAAVTIPFFTFLFRKYQPIFMLGSFFCCLQAILNECHFIYHKVYINDISAVMDLAGVPGDVVRMLGGMTIIINLAVYVFSDRKHHKLLSEFIVDAKNGIYKGLMWIMRKI